MSETPIADALSKIGSEGLEVSVSDTSSGPVTVTASGAKEIGKGWSVGGVVQAAKSGWSWAVGARWKPKQ